MANLNRLRTNWKFRFVSACALTLLGACSDLGFQGGVIPTNFLGLRTIQAVSPESFQLVWDPYPGATQYNVYVPDLNEAVARPNFTTLITPPAGNRKEDGSYSFSVTVADPVTGNELGLRSNYLSAKLLPRFSFEDGKVTPLPAGGPTGVRITWSGNPSVNYRVYLSERSASGAVTYNFGTSSASVSGLSMVDITNLQAGREYCAVVVASYLDGTIDGPDGQKLTGPISNLAVNPSGGGFTNSVAALTQKCSRTTASAGFSATVNSTTIFVPKGIPSNFPTFFVNIATDSSEDGTGPARVSVYRVDPLTNLGILLGSRVGTGSITTNQPLPAGRYKFFGLIEDNSAGATAQAKKEIVVGPKLVPAAEENRPWVYVRGLQDSDALYGNYPEQQQDGRGSIRIGSSVAMGDFNCDGRFDLAVGIPEVSETLSDNRTARLGRVMIYYDIRDPSAVSTCTRSQSIMFDISDRIPTGRNLRLGTSLFVGNFNQDNEKTNNPPSFPSSLQNENFKCDDLVIGSGYGPMFVLYGKRDTIKPGPTPSCTSATGAPESPAPDGGLNYSGAKQFQVNMSNPCSEYGECSPTMFHFQNNPALRLGTAFASGDFDGDGYTDLAASTGSGSTGIWVFRGSEYGLIGPGSFSTGSEVVQTTPGTKLSFPYIPADRTLFAEQTTPSNYILAPPASSGWGTGGFGASLGVLRNGYYDHFSSAATNTTTRRMRDVLLVGAPDISLAGGKSGRVFACIPKTNTDNGGASFSDDPVKNLSWACQYSIDSPDTVGSPSVALAARRFGASMASFRNPLRYTTTSFDNFPGCNLPGSSAKAPADFANCNDISDKLGFPGGFAVGATDTFQVFAYYGLNAPATGANTRDAKGLARNSDLTTRILTTAANATANATSNDPCSVSGSGASAVETCSVQLISHPAAQGSSGFGNTLAALPGNNLEDATTSPKESILAVTAPNVSVTVGVRTYSQVGRVYLFKQKSNNSNNPITVGGVNRYSNGFSNTLTSTIDYDGELDDFVNFGGGGVASGPLEPVVGGNVYSQNSDILVGTPGHSRKKDSAGNPITEVMDNGAGMVFFSHLGAFKNYRFPSTSINDSPWHILDSVMLPYTTNAIGQEADTRFHQAISAGDVDLDGLGDVAVRISRGSSRNTIRLYYGYGCSDTVSTSCRVGLRKPQASSPTPTPAGGSASSAPVSPYLDLNVLSDPSAGFRFIPMGPIRGGNYGAYFVTGTDDSYILFSGAGGIINAQPSLIGSPRRLSRGNKSYSGSPVYLPFSNNSFYNVENTSVDSSLSPHAPFASGDFNGDGFIDFAFAQNASSQDLTGVINHNTGTALLRASTSPPNANPVGRGRVYIFYGGGETGFQIQPDDATSGGYPLITQYTGHDNKPYGFSTFSELSPLNRSSETPCTLVSGSYVCNRAQVLAEPSTISFGRAIAAVPLGLCGDKPVHGLAVSAEYLSSSSIFLYRPACTTDSGILSGINRAAKIDSSAISATTSSTTLGISLASATSIMGSSAPANLLAHLIAVDQTSRQIFFLPVVRDTATATSPPAVVLPPPGSATTGVMVNSTTFTANGGRSLNYSTATFMGGLSGAATGMGNGVASLGDINGDGFEDVGVNFSSLDRIETNERIIGQGALLILFGGDTGPQTHNGTLPLAPSSKPECYQKSVSNAPKSICNPLVYFAPQPNSSLRKGAYERSFLSSFSRVSTGSSSPTGACLAEKSPNECLGSFLFGVPGRDSIEQAPKRPILQGGVFYVVP